MLRPLIGLMLLGSAMGACHPSPPSSPTAKAIERGPSASDSADLADTWTTTLVPGGHRGELRGYVSVETDDVWQTVGRLRFSWIAGVPTISSTFTAHDLHHFAGSEGSWYFMTQPGYLYWSEDFTGELTRVTGPSLPCETLGTRQGRGYCIDREGALWMASVTSPTEMEVHHRDIQGCTWLDEDLYLLRGDRVEVSLSGAPPVPVDVGPGPIDAVGTVGGMLLFSRGGEWFERRPDGSFHPSDSPSYRRRRQKLPSALQLIHDAERPRDQAVRERYPLRGGTAWVPPPVPEQYCAPRSPPIGGVALCREYSESGPHELSVFERTATGWAPRPPVVAYENMDWQLVTDGRGSFALLGRCDPKAMQSDDPWDPLLSMGLSICWSHQGLRQTVPIEEPPDFTSDRGELYRPWLLAMSDTWLLVDEAGKRRLYDLSRGFGPQPYWSEPVPDAIVAGPELVDGEVYAVVDHGAGRSLVRGALDRWTRVFPLPKGAQRVARSSDRRWMATGDHLDQVWGSVDGGEHWNPLVVEVDGEPALFPIDEPECTKTQCTAFPLRWTEASALEGYRAPSYIGPFEAR